MNTLSLYKLSDQFNEVLALFDDETFDAETLSDTLDGVQGEIQEKGINIVSLVKNMELSTDAIDKAVKELNARKKSIATKQEKLKEYLLFNMQRTGITKIEAPLFEIKLAKNPPSVEIINEKEIPKQFIKEKVVTTIDKTAIKKAGGCNGAKIIDDKQRLVIK